MRYIKLLTVFCAMFVLGTSCVDDYTDSNPPHLADAPFFQVSAAGNSNINIAVTALNKYTAYMNYGDPAEITVNVISAPGKIGDVSISSSIEEYGTVALDEASFAAVKGKTSGTFKFTFTPSSELPDTKDRALNIVVAVSDTQLDEKGEASPLTSTVTVPITLVNGPCLSDGIAVGTYAVSDASGNQDGGDPYDMAAIISNTEGVYAADHVVVVITKIRPGVYLFSEATGGFAPGFFGSKPNLRIDLCDNEISGRTGYVTSGGRIYTLSGTLNTDGTIDMTWSYVKSSGTPADPASGSYKLTPL